MDLNLLKTKHKEFIEQQRPVYKLLNFNLLKIAYDELWENTEEIIKTLNENNEKILPAIISGTEDFLNISYDFIVQNDLSEKLINRSINLFETGTSDPIKEFNEYIISQPYSFAFNIYYKYKEAVELGEHDNCDILTEKLDLFITAEIIEEFQDQICQSEYFLNQPKDQVEFFIRFLNKILEQAIKVHGKTGLLNNYCLPSELFFEEEQQYAISLSRYQSFTEYFNHYAKPLTLESK